MLPEFQKSRAWEADASEIYEAYASDDFETSYAVTPMKELPRTYLEPFKLSTLALAGSPWMMRMIREITQ